MPLFSLSLGSYNIVYDLNDPKDAMKVFCGYSIVRFKDLIVDISMVLIVIVIIIAIICAYSRIYCNDFPSHVRVTFSIDFIF